MSRLLLPLALLQLSLGCGGSPQQQPPLTARGTDLAPAAVANIEVRESAGAQQLDIEVEHLAPPERLGQNVSQYGVWIVPFGQEPVFAGSLEFDADEQIGRLLASTPYDRFAIVVTAEGAIIGDVPSDKVVLRQPVQ